MKRNLIKSILCLVALAALPSVNRAQAPVLEFTTAGSTIKFDVESSVAIVGKFNKWDARLIFTSPELSIAVLDIKIQAATVDTGSAMKNGKLEGKDFFDVEHDPLIAFHSASPKNMQTPGHE